MKKTKLKWQQPDYFPLEQAMVKSGSAFNNSAEGETFIIPIQGTFGPNNPLICGNVYTTFTTAPTTGAASLCDPNVQVNYDLSVNYCSVCL